MVADQPLVVYPKSEDEKKSEPTRNSMDDLAERWAAKNKGNKSNGQKVDLNAYLRNGIS